MSDNEYNENDEQEGQEDELSDEELAELEEIDLDAELEEEDEYEYVYGIAMPQLPEGLQPLDCVVLIEGIMMDTGQPTITALGSENMKPWVASGMLRMEAARLEQGYIFGGLMGTGFTDEEDDEDYEEDD